MTSRTAWFWLGVTLAFFLFLFLIRAILLPFVVGMLIAYFLSPAVDKLVRRRAPRPLAVFLLLGCFFTVLTFAVLMILPVLAGQLSGLVRDLPDYLMHIQEVYAPTIAEYTGSFHGFDREQLQASLSEHSGTALKFAAGFLAGAFKSGMALINAASLILITPVVAFYLMNDWHQLVARVDALLPRRHAPTIRQQVAIIDDTLAGFVRGQVNVCLIMAVYYALALTLTGLKFGIIIGLFTGLLVIVPYVGFFVCFVAGMTVAYFQFPDHHSLLYVLLAFLIGQLIEGNYLTPKLVGEKVGLHPVWVIFGLLAGGALFGFVGVLLAVPVSAVVGVLLRFATQNYLRSGYYFGK